MRIHHVSPETTGIVWQISSNRGVRAVLIRDKPLPTVFAVSWRPGPIIETPTGPQLWFTHKVAHAALADLFATEQDARIEFHRRRVALAGTVLVPVAPTLADGALAGLAIGLALLMLSI